MTPENALNIVDQAVAKFVGTREDHYNLQMAVSVLRREIAKATAPDVEPEVEPNEPEA